MTGRNKICAALTGLILFSGGSALHADTIVRELGRENGEPKPYAVPYAFVEFGRVASEWVFDELHDSMNNDVGLSLRVMANQDIGRLDLVWSEDDAAAWLMYGHPF